MSVIYRAKGDAMAECNACCASQTASLDVVIGDSMVVSDVVQADIDSSIEAFEEMDQSITREAREARKPKRFVDTINLDETIQKNIANAVSKANISTEGLNYKDVKKLTTSKDAPLSNVLNAIASEFGIPPSKVVKPADLNKAEREAAQQYIKNTSKALLNMLPEGEPNSG